MREFLKPLRNNKGIFFSIAASKSSRNLKRECLVGRECCARLLLDVGRNRASNNVCVI